MLVDGSELSCNVLCQEEVVKFIMIYYWCVLCDSGVIW